MKDTPLSVHVKHKEYGTGEVLRVEGEYITVQFESKTAKFLLPDAFAGYIEFADPSDETRFAALLNGHEELPLLPDPTLVDKLAIPPITQGSVIHKRKSKLDVALEKAIDLFHDFKLTEASKEELKKYFRYLARHLPVSKQIQYNFFIHSVDAKSTRRFVSLFFNVCHAFDPRYGLIDATEKTVTFEERDKYPLPQKIDVVPQFEGITFLTERDVISGPEDKFILYHSMVVVDDCYSLDLYENKTEEIVKRNQAWKKFVRFCEESPYICKVICAEETTIKERFEIDEHLYCRVFQHHIYFDEYTAAEISEGVKNILTEGKMKLQASFCAALDSYSAEAYQKSDLQGESYIRDLANQIQANYYGSSRTDNILRACDIPSCQNPVDPRAALDELVGLKDIKNKIRELEGFARFYKDSKEHGVLLDGVSLHMLFTGNPGTGKTTVARLIASMLCGIGIIKKDKVIEVNRKDLCAEYIGQSAVKTQRVIDKAKGGVLFVDEAYMLSQYDSQNDYGAEVIETIMGAMENSRDDLVVIFAGYEDEMVHFVESNPGLESRIGYTFHFADYSDEEMQEIFRKQIKKQGMLCSEAADDMVVELWHSISGRTNAGNGRLVRKVTQAVVLKHANRVARLPAVTQMDYRTITTEDIPSSDEIHQMLTGAAERHPIGFDLA